MQVEDKVREFLLEDKLDAIVCVAGGWAGGDAASVGMLVHMQLSMLITWLSPCRLGEKL